MVGTWVLPFLVLATSFDACHAAALFLQGHSRAVLQQDRLVAEASKQPSCTTLANHGTHFTVDVTVGTPPQTFAVVADTGSNNLIVPSCVCMDQDHCDKSNRCFRGTNHSSTFLLDTIDGKGPMGMLITFGSGKVSTVLSTDVARVAGVSATMHNGLLLMVNQALRMSGPFEGILGLGLPRGNASLPVGGSQEGGSRVSSQSTSNGGEGAAADADIQKVVEEVMKGLGGAGAPRGAVAESAFSIPAEVILVEERIPFPNVPAESSSPAKQAPQKSVPEPKGFLEEANITRFSMCFNDGANGTLLLDTAPVEQELESVGTFHWGLDLRGISLGAKSVKVQLCSRDNMTKGQMTACAAIPDSGTTAIMAPQEHLDVLIDTICDDWDRCRDNHTAFLQAQDAAHKAAAEKYGFDPFGIDKSKVKKETILKLLLQDCAQWMTPEHGLNELPSINFEVAGKSGDVKNLSMTGWSYVMKQEVELVEKVYKDFGPLGKIAIGVNKTGRVEEVCMLGLSAMDYKTSMNGPVWIFGTPFFYSYNVGYNLDREKPAISFTSVDESPCSQCGGPALVDSGLASGTHAVQSAASPRRVKGPWRVPNFDLSQPL